MSDWIVVCPVGEHPANYEYHGPFDGAEHARLWIYRVHTECPWLSNDSDYGQNRGHLLRRVQPVKVGGA